MKDRRFIQCALRLALLLAFAFAGATAFAEAPDVPGLDLILTKLFSTNLDFTAKSDLRVLDGSGRETTRAALNYAVLNGRIRTDVDMSQARSVHTPAGAVATIKSIGEVVSIIRPDRKLTLLIYPNLRAYAEIPFNKTDPASIQANYRVDKTRLGTDSIHGYVCDKDRVVLTGDKGEKVEAIVWFAANLRNFPLQIQTTDPGEIRVITFSDVKFGRADNRLFEAPPGMTKYDAAQMVKKLNGPDGQK